MRTLCFTVDLDRDVNEARPGCIEAGSKDRGYGKEPRFESAGKGAEKIVDMLDDLGMKATFFAEARTLHRSGAFSCLSGQEIALHGLDHEDFTGERTGVYLDEGEMREIIERAISLIRDCVGRQPKGFRAPYMAMDDDLLYLLPEYGIRYDSSQYAYADRVMRPYRLENGIIEVPVPKGNDPSGASMTSYLWPMHECARSADEFIRLAENTEEGVFVLATHSWHVVESRDRGIMDEAESERNIADIRRILETLQDDGFSVQTIEQTVL